MVGAYLSNDNSRLQNFTKHNALTSGKIFSKVNNSSQIVNNGVINDDTLRFFFLIINVY